MPKVHITTDAGELIETVDATGYDLDKPIARAAFHSDIDEAVTRAQRIEATR